jgi:uncharacterized protein YehS (DUF1456 family)
MLNNDILRRLRYTLNLSDNEMIAMFASANRAVSRQQVSAWLKKEGATGFAECTDRTLAIFLNGLINEKRGKREGIQPNPENKLNNNIIFKKLRIAFNLKDDDILAMLEDAGLKISKHELSAFFRAPEHRQSRQCKDQVLRNFLNGLQKKYATAVKEAPKKTANKSKPSTSNKPKREILSLGKTQAKKATQLSSNIENFQWKEK